MRVESAAQAKGKCTSPVQLAPREGTRIRRLYDLLMANKGIPIDFSPTRFEGDKAGTALSQLQNFYGLDIRKLGYGRWVLAGEWFGKVYVDYIADRLREAERRQ